MGQRLSLAVLFSFLEPHTLPFSGKIAAETRCPQVYHGSRGPRTSETSPRFAAIASEELFVRRQLLSGGGSRSTRSTK